MKHTDLETMIEIYHSEQREERNAALRARLARPCSREELLDRLRALAAPCCGRNGGNSVDKIFRSVYNGNSEVIYE